MQKTEAVQGDSEGGAEVRAVLNVGEIYTLQAAIVLRIEHCNHEVVAARNDAAARFWDGEKRKAYAIQTKLERLLGHIAAGN